MNEHKQTVETFFANMSVDDHGRPLSTTISILSGEETMFMQDIVDLAHVSEIRFTRRRFDATDERPEEDRYTLEFKDGERHHMLRDVPALIVRELILRIKQPITSDQLNFPRLTGY